MGVTIKTVDASDSGLDKTKTPDVTDWKIRIDRGLKVYPLGIPSCIAQLFDLDSMPVFVTDFGKSRIFITINFVLKESTKALTETEFLDWSHFVRNNCFKAGHVYLEIGDEIQSMGEPLTDSGEGVEGKVVRFYARREEGDDAIYCTLQFAHCIELDLLE